MSYHKTISCTILACLGVLLCITGCQPAQPVSGLPGALPSATAIPTAAPVPVMTPAPTETIFYPPTPTLASPLVERIAFNPQPALPPGLSVTIYRMDQPILAEEVGYEQAQSELKERSRWVAQNLNDYKDRGAGLDASNAALAPFGYQIEMAGTNKGLNIEYTLRHGDQVVLERIFEFSPVIVNRSKNDFILLAGTVGNGFHLVQSQSIAAISLDDFSLPAAYPRFLGDDVISAREEQAQGKTVVQVYRNDTPVYQTSSDVVHVRPMLYGLWTYGDHWAVEVLDGISIDGQAVNQLYNYQKSYEFSLIAGIPIYFFEKNGQLGLNFNGQPVLLGGQSTPHYNCCSGALLNPRKNGNMLIFFMQNGEQWDYVEVEVKP